MAFTIKLKVCMHTWMCTPFLCDVFLLRVSSQTKSKTLNLRIEHRRITCVSYRLTLCT
jgi:hypothetical protein